MDRISELSNALLLQILSLVQTKDLVATSVLSTRWQDLWMLVPKLEYDVVDGIDSRFVTRFLLLHKAPVLERLSLRIDMFLSTPVDIGIWVRTAVDRGVRELEIECSSNKDPIRLPKSFYTCETLVVLKLKNYSDDKSLETLLSSCFSLKDLVVECCPNDDVSIFTIKIPSLESLSLDKSSKDSLKNFLGFVIDAPSLKYFTFVDYRGYFCLASDMPELVEANLDIVYDKIDKLLGSLTSVKRLSICSTKSNDPCLIGTTFHQLIHLELCTCETEWLNLLMCLLKVTPKLRVLKLQRTHKDRSEDGHWNQPLSIPDCLLTSLEIFKWKLYKGTKDQRNLATYILRNSCCLKTSKIRTKTNDHKERLEMIKELALSPRASTTCELDFD